MTGTPWHIEYLRKAENDDRRHKARCIRYRGGYCSYYSSRCKGSSHCRYYKEINSTPLIKINKIQPLLNAKTIGLNSKVQLYDLSNKEHINVTLVEGNGDLSKASDFKISIDSALAQKLVGCKVGSNVEVNGFRYRIIWYSQDGSFNH